MVPTFPYVGPTLAGYLGQIVQNPSRNKQRAPKILAYRAHYILSTFNYLVQPGNPRGYPGVFLTNDIDLPMFSRREPCFSLSTSPNIKDHPVGVQRSPIKVSLMIFKVARWLNITVHAVVSSKMSLRLAGFSALFGLLWLYLGWSALSSLASVFGIYVVTGGYDFLEVLIKTFPRDTRRVLNFCFKV